MLGSDNQGRDILSTIMHGASFETTYSSYTRMEIQKTYHSIAVTPVNISEVIAGEILWGATKSLFSGAIMVSAVVAMGILPTEYLPNLIWLIPLLVLEALLFSALGMLMTSFARDYDFFTYYFTLFVSPMFLFSGTFFPLENLPGWARTLAYFLPLTYPVRVARHLFAGQFSGMDAVCLGGMLVAASLIGLVAVRRLVRRLVV